MELGFISAVTDSIASVYLPSDKDYFLNVKQQNVRNYHKIL